MDVARKREYMLSYALGFEWSIQPADESMPQLLDDLIGQKFGNLRVIERSPRRPEHSNTYWIVECEVCGRAKAVQRGVLFRIRASGCRHCNHREAKKRELIGQRIDRVTVVDFVGTDKHDKLVWKVRCGCDTEFECVTSYLRARQRTGRFACNTCLRKKEDEKWFWSYRIAEMRSNAKTRKLKWALSDEQARVIMEKACTYCGSPPTERSRNRQDKVRSTVKLRAGSIDRVDSKLGYLKDNCVPSCDLCNRMKSDLTVSGFIDLCERIYAKHGTELSA